MKLNVRKSKTSYTVMIISDSAKKHRKEFHIKASAVGIVTVVTFLLLVVLVCYVVYSSITLSDSLERSKKQKEQIVQLSETNERLTLEKEELEGKVAILSETVNQKVEAEQALAAEEEEAHLPKGFPLSGTAQLKTEENTAEETADEDDGDNGDENAVQEMHANGERKEVIFNASAGVNVISSGAGTVIAADVDADYGNIISIDHGNGYISIYRNGGTPVVKVGSEVARGAILYVVGEDNLETGYSISKDGTYVDPMEMIEING